MSGNWQNDRQLLKECEHLKTRHVSTQREGALLSEQCSTSGSARIARQALLGKHCKANIAQKALLGKHFLASCSLSIAPQVLLRKQMQDLAAAKVIPSVLHKAVNLARAGVMHTGQKIMQ